MQTRTHYLFAGLSEAQFRSISRSTRIQELAADQMLFNRGDRARWFFLLQTGSVALYRDSSDGHEKVMRFIQPGQTFAESVMFMDDPLYPVNARAERSSRLLAIDAQSYFSLMHDCFDTCRAIFAWMNTRILDQWDEIERLSLQNSRYRVVHYILSLCSDISGADSGRITLPARKSVIATYLAITPETLSRVLRELGNKGLVEVHGYELHVADIPALRCEID